MKNQRLIFLRVPRCGSASLAQLCRNNEIFDIYGGRDMGFWGSKIGLDYLKQKLNHLNTKSLSKRVVNKIGLEQWRNSYKFASVRDPYARAVSIWRHKSFNKFESFEYFCQALYQQKFYSDCAKWHAVVISDHIFLDGELKIDKVVKLESIAQDLAELSKHLGRPLKHYQNELTDNSRRKGTPLLGGKSYSQFYTKETAEMILEIYKKDFENFEYDTELPIYQSG